jgi:hypothetical protein
MVKVIDITAKYHKTNKNEMTEIELAQAIRDYIMTLYKACYIG